MYIYYFYLLEFKEEHINLIYVEIESRLKSKLCKQKHFQKELVQFDIANKSILQSTC